MLVSTITPDADWSGENTAPVQQFHALKNSQIIDNEDNKVDVKKTAGVRVKYHMARYINSIRSTNGYKVRRKLS